MATEQNVKTPKLTRNFSQVWEEQGGVVVVVAVGVRKFVDDDAAAGIRSKHFTVTLGNGLMEAGPRIGIYKRRPGLALAGPADLDEGIGIVEDVLVAPVLSRRVAVRPRDREVERRPEQRVGNVGRTDATNFFRRTGIQTEAEV